MKQQEDTEISKREMFRKFLFKLASNEMLLQDSNNIITIYKELDDIYFIDNNEKTFRHFYSDIYSTLRLIKSNSVFGTIAYLLQNIEILRTEFNHYSNEINFKTKKLEECLKKIYDHTSLEIARMDDSDERDREISLESSIKDMENRISLNYNRLNKDYYNKLNNKLKNIQKDYVGILSIFAAVIVAFTAGTAFSSSVLNNIDNVTIYRLIFTCLLLGCVLINVLYVLFSFILIIVKENKLDIKACLIPNAIIIALLVSTAVAWYFGTVEARNERLSINNKQEQNETKISVEIYNKQPSKLKEKIETENNKQKGA